MAISIEPIKVEGRPLQGPTCDPKGRSAAPGSRKFMGGLMLVLACAVSPCCAPLYVPFILALAAGTPLAAWIGQSLGWIYGFLTILSVVMAVLAFRWLRKRSR